MEPPARPLTLKFGSYLVDFSAGELRKNGTRVRLQEKPLRVLALLAERQGQVVTREELKQHLWRDDTFVEFEAGLNTAVSKLRDALSDDAAKPRYIETIPRRGYRFLAPVTFTDDGIDKRLTSGSVPPENTGIHSVAVLPFENLSAEASQDHLADGMTDTLITALSKMGTLRVISRTSAMRYQKVRKSLPDIARELGVEFVVEGSLLRFGNSLRITVQFIDGTTDKHLWAERFDGDFSDVLSFLDRTAAASASEVMRRLGRRSGTPDRPMRKIAPEASNAYLQGRHEFYRYSEAGLMAAMDCYGTAIQADPSFALAYSAMAHAYCAMVAPVSAIPPRELFGKAEALARKALSLDDSIAEARFALGLTELMFRWDWNAGERETRLALALDPNNATARIVLGICHIMAGATSLAVDECKYACILDPLSPFTRTALHYCLYFSRNYTELKETMAADRARLTGFFKFHILEGLNAIHEQKWESAIQEFRKALDATGGCSSYASAHLGYALAASGQHEEARAITNEMLGMAEVRYVPATDFAIVAIGLGEYENALDWLDKAFQERSNYLIYICHDALFDRLRPEPRFQNLIRQIGMADGQHIS